MERVVRACPLQAHWFDGGEPIGDVEVMAGVLDKYRRFVVDDRPVVTGIVSVGDALGLHQPLGRARHQRRHDPRPAVARRRP